LAEALVLLAQTGVGGGEDAIVEIVLVGQARDHSRHLALARLSLFNAAAHQAFEFSHCTHQPGERADGVLVESGLVKRLWPTTRAERHTSSKAEQLPIGLAVRLAACEVIE